MQLVNFQVGNDYISINYNDSYIDLHNNFDYVGYEHELKDNLLKIFFSKSNGDWAKNEIFKTLEFRFEQVDFLENQQLDYLGYSNEDSHLNSLGFSSLSMRENMNSFLIDNNDSEAHDLIFIFENEKAIKVHAQKGSIIIS